VTQRTSKSSPRTDRRATPSESGFAQASKKAGRPSADSEQAAHAAIAHEAPATPSGDKAKLHLTISLARHHAARLTARAVPTGS